ncbi:hypothetical protein ACG90_17590 [Pseudomonas aeruginosa]|nr:hypothetical protein Q047_03416 [Pseudomonas aeruginosa BWHPSA042]OOH28282.1 hypothetical protein B0B32_04060 [Pseudomonas aeruginosa]OOH38978.1 hypothetical protein B0B31_27840 [Pseudomonas aeruginosa]OXZ15117.1 hypothetical protein ACG90_17590 [Pseudomonas aeruginosa]
MSITIIIMIRLKIPLLKTKNKYGSQGIFIQIPILRLILLQILNTLQQKLFHSIAELIIRATNPLIQKGLLDLMIIW